MKGPLYSNQAAKQCMEKLAKGATIDSCQPNKDAPAMEPDGEDRFCGSLTKDGAIDVVKFSELIAAAM